MTNAQIILNESVSLMNQGILAGTGQFITMKKKDGATVEVEMPEEIHTYAAWKEAGYQVRKGEKAVAAFTIWKYRSKKGECQMLNVDTGKMETEEVDLSKMFMKTAHFFKRSQVEKIEK